MRLRLLAVLPVLGLLSLACASGNPNETPEVGERETNLNVQMRKGGQNLNLRTTSEIDVVHDTVAGDPDELFSTLPEAYDNLGIPISTVNAEAKTIGVLETRAQGDFAGERISLWLDCGESITGNVADQREIYLTVLTQVEPLEGAEGTGVSTHLRGYAVQGGNRRDCSSQSRLERRIAAELRELVEASG